MTGLRSCVLLQHSQLPESLETHNKRLLQADVTQTRVGNVAHEDPPDFKDALPFVRSPDRAAPSVVDLD